MDGRRLSKVGSKKPVSLIKEEGGGIYSIFNLFFCLMDPFRFLYGLAVFIGCGFMIINSEVIFYIYF